MSLRSRALNESARAMSRRASGKYDARAESPNGLSPKKADWAKIISRGRVRSVTRQISCEMRR